MSESTYLKNSSKISIKLCTLLLLYTVTTTGYKYCHRREGRIHAASTRVVHYTHINWKLTGGDIDNVPTSRNIERRSHTCSSVSSAQHRGDLRPLLIDDQLCLFVVHRVHAGYAGQTQLPALEAVRPHYE